MAQKYTMVEIYSLGGSDMKATVFIKQIAHNLPQIDKFIKYLDLNDAYGSQTKDMSNTEVNVLLKYMHNDGSCDSKHMVKYTAKINVPTKPDDADVDTWFDELFEWGVDMW